MKAMLLTGICEMEMRDVPKPAIRHGDEVLLKLAVVGVCGTDVHYYESGRVGRQVVQYPFTLGHECAAIVEAVGKDVTRVCAGSRVFVEPAMSCGTCDQCLAERPNTCRNIRFLACPEQAEGCLSEYIVMPEECCFPLQDKTTLEQAAIAEPLSVGWYAVQQSIPMKKAAVAILGAGPIGLSVMLSAIHLGAKKVYVTDILDNRLRIAKDRGAAWVGNPTTREVVQGIRDEEPLLLDVVFECCGKQEALDQAVALLKPGGKLVIVGIPETERVSFDIDYLRRKEICIQNIRRQNGCVEPALDLIENRRIPIDFMITHRFPLEKTKDAFDLVSRYADGVMKAMVLV